jgi:putative ABC transport system permease protein
MLLAALRDLQWRRRRFVITVFGTALVFAMSLIMSALSNSFRVEVDRTLDRQAAAGWISAGDAPGAFSLGSFLLPADIAVIAAAVPGSAPAMYGSTIAVTDDGAKIDVTVFGLTDGAIGAPSHVIDGSPSLTHGVAIVPRSMGLAVGESFRLGVLPFLVGGVIGEASLLGGTPTVIVSLSDAQATLVEGAPLASTMLAPGSVTVPGYRTFTRGEVRDDFLRPLSNAMNAIDFVNILLWIVAALIVASVVYLTVLERTRDLAVFKASGATTARIASGVCLQAVVIAVAASLVGIGLAYLLAPAFPLEVVISTRSVITLPVLAVAVGVLAGLVGVRRVAAIEPATAFGGPS